MILIILYGALSLGYLYYSPQILAALPEFEDHHIIAVNPIGWWETTMNTPVYDHEENAEVVMELLELLDIEEAMVAGYSSGMYHLSL